MSVIAGFVVSAIALFVLFLLPGWGATGLVFPRDDLDLFELLPLGFGLVLGIFFVVFLTVMTLALNWQAVIWIWAAVALILSAAGAIRWRSSFRRERLLNLKLNRINVAVLVFALVLVLSALLTLFTPRDEDDWSYYPIVRAFIDASRFQPISQNNLRAGLSVWWFFHAFLIRWFNFDIVQLGREYLPFLLVPLSFLAFYAFAKALLKDMDKAILASVLLLGFYVIDLFYNDPNVQLTGGWVLGRMDQAHTAAQFIFLPIYLMLVFRYIETGGIRWLAASFVVLLTLSAVHPQGFVEASILLGAFLALNLVLARPRETFKRIAILLIPFAVVLLLLLPFISYWLKVIQNQSAYFDLSRLAYGQSDFPYTFRWITFLSRNDFILRPDLLGQPLLLSALLLTPLLVPRLRKHMTARFLFGSMMALLVALFIPIPFVLLSYWLGWTIYRTWYSFPSVLVLVYLAPQILRWVSVGISQLQIGAWNRKVLAGALCIAGLILVASRFPEYVRGAPMELGVQNRLPAGSLELFVALRNTSPAGGVVLAPRSISDPIPSYRTYLFPVLFRYNTSQERLDDASVYYSLPLLTLDSLMILNKYDVAYLIMPTDTESISQFDLSPDQFAPLYRNPYWALYQVSAPRRESAVLQGNTLYMRGDLQGAIDQYNLALSQDPSNSLAHTGLGMVLQVLNKPRLAARELEEAIRLAPSNAQAHYHLAVVYHELGMDQEAKIHAAAAGPLMKVKK